MSVEPNIRLQYEALLWSSRPDVRKLVRFTRHVSVVLPVEHKNCVTLCHHLKQEQYYYRTCVVVILCKGTFEMAFV